MIRLVIRSIIGVREHESIVDALDRIFSRIMRLLYREKYTTNMLEKALRQCGLSEGDAVLVHCSWRRMFNYEGSPECLISLLMRIVGKNGTILMPCYGHDRLYLDVENTPSQAGVLSEVFRKMDGVRRSACTHFSVAGIGRDADSILSEHINSQYGFDQYSPCYKLCTHENGKVLLLGLGSKPTKISIFHCAGWLLRDSDTKLKKLLSYEYDTELVFRDCHLTKKMIQRMPNHRNHKANFRRILKSITNKKHVKLSNMDIVVIDAKEALTKSVVGAEKGIYCYHNMNTLR